MTLTNRERKELNRQAKARRLRKAGTKLLTATKPKVREKPEDRDGLLWLIAKSRLTRPRVSAAKFYRRLHRDAPLDDGARIKSNLDRSVGGGAGELPALVQADASTKLRFVRAALSHHPQMIELLDSVCGGGLMIREVVGPKQREIEAGEAVLKIALDLVALAQAQIETADLCR